VKCERRKVIAAAHDEEAQKYSDKNPDQLENMTIPPLRIFLITHYYCQKSSQIARPTQTRRSKSRIRPLRICFSSLSLELSRVGRKKAILYDTTVAAK
jgi:hypothetical protein